MSILDMLQQSGGIGTMAKELGINESVAEAGAAALLPAILGGFKKTTQAQPSGLDGLGGLLGQLGGGGLLDSVLGTQPTPVEKGNEVLGQIFGSKEVSRTVAAGAEQQTGISSDLLKKSQQPLKPRSKLKMLLNTKVQPVAMETATGTARVKPLMPAKSISPQDCKAHWNPPTVLLLLPQNPPQQPNLS